MIRKAGVIITSPVVPRYEENQVKTQGIQGPKASNFAPDFSGLNQGLHQTTAILAGIAEQEKAKGDRTAVLESRTALDQTETDLLYNPEKGALNARGKNAFGIPEPTLQAYDASVAAIEGNLTNQQQKDAFKTLALQRRGDIDKQLQRHVYGEMKTYADEQNKSALASTLNNVARFSDDPERVQQELKFGQAVIASDGESAGIGGTALKLRQDLWTSKVQETVIEKMLIDNPIKAKEYFDGLKKDNGIPDENIANKLEKLIKPLATKQLGMNTALDLAKQLGTRQVVDVLADARTALKNDPDALNIAETQIKQMEVERRDNIKQVAEAASAPIYKKIAEIQGSGRAAKLTDIPSAEWANLIKAAPEEAGKIQDALRREVTAELDRAERKADRQERKADRQEREAERLQTKTTQDNLTTWGALKLNPQMLGKTNVDALYVQGKLNKTQYQDLITDQLSLKTNGDKHEAKVLSTKQAVDTVLHSVGIRNDAKDEEGSGKYLKFYEKLNERLKMFETENGTKPKQDDIVKMSRGLLSEVSQDRSFWFDKTVKAFEADPAKVVVPRADKDAIIKALQKNKKPVTEEAIRSLYLEKQTRGVK